ncbi:MAG: TlpA family protein disulfide reductase [Candidatus Marinimicrobia bacterium]|nr:TlpA family protein disulfide reductase [Candidatus Neomarinimicrobiota bacterium]
MKKYRFVVPLILVLAVATAVAVITPSSPDTKATPPVEPGLVMAPDFTLTSMNGRPITMSKLRGKVVLINFWATWCPPCRQEIPDLSNIYANYKDKDFVILGISLDDLNTDEIAKFARNYRMTYPVLHGPRSELGDITMAYGGIQAIPTTFLIDKQGYIRKVYVGARSEKVFLEDIKSWL